MSRPIHPPNHTSPAGPHLPAFSSFPPWKSIEEVTSSRNPKFLTLRRTMEDAKVKRPSPQVVAEGIRLVDMALQTHRASCLCFPNTPQGAELFDKLSTSYGAQAADRASQHNFLRLAEKLWAQLPFHHSQVACLALAEAPSFQTLGSICLTKSSRPGPLPLYLLADRVQDPGNLGNIIRTADAMGFAGAFLLPGTVSPLTSKLLRYSMGSTFFLPLFQLPDLDSWSKLLRDQALALVLMDLDGESLYDLGQAHSTLETALYGSSYRGLVIGVGNEANGLGEDLLALPHVTVTIPQRGGAESLNASSAFAMAAYAFAQRQRKDL